MPYYIYILECSNKTFYTGYTTDIKRRYQEHCDGSSKCKYTRSFPPRSLAAYWEIEGDLSFVMKIEHQIKRLSKQQKRALIKHKNLNSVYSQISAAIPIASKKVKGKVKNQA